MPKITESKRKSRINKIHEAAYRCIIKKGYANTSIRDISEEAGISLGGLYVYFDSKEGIIQSMAAEGINNNRALIEESGNGSDTGGDPVSLIASFIHKFSEPGGTDGIRADISIWDAAFQNETLYDSTHDSFSEFVEYCCSQISETQRRGRIREDLDPQALAHIMLSLIQGFGIQMALGIDIDPTQYMETIHTLMISLPDK